MKIKKKCFVISKFGDTLSKSGVDYEEAEAFFEAIKDTLDADEADIENNNKIYKVERVSEDRGKKGIKNRIFKSIINADLVISNLQPNKFGSKHSFNANVMYETALRHTLNTPIIHFIEDTFIAENKLPFDLNDNFTIPYKIIEGKVMFDKESLYKEIEAIYENDEPWQFCEILRKEKTYCYSDFTSGYSHLVNWKKSQILEQEAEEVYSVTSNLSWTLLTYEGIIKNIIRDKDKNILNRHCYIFIRDEHDKRENQDRFKEIIEIEGQKLKVEHNIDIHNHIKLISISQADFNKKCQILDTDEPPMLPKPVDMVLYVKTKDILKKRGKKTYLVMSVNKVEENIPEEDFEKYYDVIFKDDEHIDVAMKWFKHVWHKLCGEKL